MEENTVCLVERITARSDQVEELKGTLQRVAAQIRQLPGVLQLELFQNQQNSVEFIFFVMVNDLEQASEILDLAEWHQQFVSQLPLLTDGNLERMVGPKIA